MGHGLLLSRTRAFKVTLRTCESYKESVASSIVLLLPMIVISIIEEGAFSSIRLITVTRFPGCSSV